MVDKSKALSDYLKRYGISLDYEHGNEVYTIPVDNKEFHISVDEIRTHVKIGDEVEINYSPNYKVLAIILHKNSDDVEIVHGNVEAEMQFKKGNLVVEVNHD